MRDPRDATWLELALFVVGMIVFVGTMALAARWEPH